MIDDPRYGHTLTYDETGRLTQINYSNGQAQYSYNALGQRVTKVVATSGPLGSSTTLTTHFHYSPTGQLLAETDGNGNLIREYIVTNNQPAGMVVKATNLIGQTTTQLS